MSDAPVPQATPEVPAAPAAPLPPLIDPHLLTAPPTTPAWLRWAGMFVFVGLLYVPGALLADDRYWLPLFTRYLALALFALSVDLVWGYTGLLSLGQGVYFGLGASSRAPRLSRSRVMSRIFGGMGTLIGLPAIWFRRVAPAKYPSSYHLPLWQ